MNVRNTLQLDAWVKENSGWLRSSERGTLESVAAKAAGELKCKINSANVSQVMKQNPDLMRNMVSAVERSREQQTAPQGGPREMRGPGMDFGSLMNMMGPPPSQATRTGPSGGPDDDLSDIVSIDAGDGDVREVQIGSEKKKRGPKGGKKKEVSL